MKHHYPSGSEHEYLWEWIQMQYFVEDDREVDPLYKAGWEAYVRGERDRYREIHRLIKAKQWELCQRRWRREDILNWLWLDSELRKEDRTYPDAYEKPREVCSVNEF